MRNFALGFLLALSVSASASPDDVIGLPRGDVEQLLFKLRLAEQESIRYDLDRAKAIRVLAEQRAKIEELEGRKCL